MTNSSPVQGALNGVTVVDLTHHIAGPYAPSSWPTTAQTLSRSNGPVAATRRAACGRSYNDEPSLDGSGLFLHLNTNKNSVTLNLKSPAGKEALLRLVKDADIVVENFAPRVMPSLGLDYEALRE